MLLKVCLPDTSTINGLICHFLTSTSHSCSGRNSLDFQSMNSGRSAAKALHENRA